MWTVTRADKSAIKSEIMPNQYLSDLARVAKIPDGTKQLTEEKTIFGVLI